MSKRDKRWGAAIGDEVTARTRDLFPLPMGIEREDRCEQTVLQLGRGARFFGLRFWSRRIATKHPGLTAILVPDSNTTED